jgi:hypothetical protein
MSTATDTALTTVYWGTNYAGQIVGVTDSNAANGVSQNPLAINCQLNVNSSDDLSSIIVANSGGNAKTIQYVNSGGLRQGQIRVYGQGPKGTGSGSLDLYFLTLGGFVHTLGLTSSTPDWHTDDFEDTTSIISIWWAQSVRE